MIQNGRLTVELGDITLYAGDAIVNAANETLLGGGGVDGAIHLAAGFHLRIACAKLGGCKKGDAKITPAFKLPSKWIIHTVGPVYHGGSRGEQAALASCYRHCLEVAVQNGVTSIAFPAISCGIFGYPIDEAAYVATKEILTFLDTAPSIEEVRVICFSDDIFESYRDPLAQYPF